MAGYRDSLSLDRGHCIIDGGKRVRSGRDGSSKSRIGNASGRIRGRVVISPKDGIIERYRDGLSQERTGISP
jgi:hypothetical protein